MELQEFIENFAKQFDDIEVSDLTADTVFQDLDEWSSLTSLGVIAFVKTSYNKTITNKEIRSCETIGELFDFVKTK